MKHSRPIFYLLISLIVALGVVLLVGSGQTSRFLNNMAGSGIKVESALLSHPAPTTFRMEFINDPKFLALRDDWLAPVSFAELTASSSAIKQNVGFVIGNQNLFQAIKKK